MLTRNIVSAASAALLLLAASGCGGGGGSSSSTDPGGVPPTPHAAGLRLGITVTAAPGSRFPFAEKSAKSGTPATAQAVSVTYNGTQVASGTLDDNGFAELTFTQTVPSGATVSVTVGTGSTAVVVSVTLATAISATSSDVVYSAGPPPTITVATSADNNGDGHVDPTDAQQQTETENPSNGDAENVNSLNDNVLPSNLPVTISACGNALTIAPVAGETGLGLHFQEKVSDRDSNSEFEYETATFNGPLTFPILSSAARIELELTQNGQQILSVEAPLGAVTGSAASGSPSASPGSCPTLSPLPTPSP